MVSRADQLASNLSLAKFSLLVDAALVVSVISLDLLRRRRFPWPMLVYLVGLLVFWIVAGQPLRSIGPFIVNSLRVSGGFNEAMMLSGPHEALDVSLFLAAVALMTALAGLAAWRRHGLALPDLLRGGARRAGLSNRPIRVSVHGRQTGDWQTEAAGQGAGAAGCLGEG